MTLEQLKMNLFLQTDSLKFENKEPPKHDGT